jgi:hypothetical protein
MPAYTHRVINQPKWDQVNRLVGPDPDRYQDLDDTFCRPSGIMGRVSPSQPVGPNAVHDEVVAAGLPVLLWEPSEAFRGTGVSIQADADDPEVWIGWVTSDALRNAATKALRRGLPARRLGGASRPPTFFDVKDAMLAAIAEILVAAGFRVEKDADDMRPSELLVLGRQPGPSLRGPVIPPLAGSSLPQTTSCRARPAACADVWRQMSHLLSVDEVHGHGVAGVAAECRHGPRLPRHVGHH